MEKGIFKTIFLVTLLACGSQAVWGMKDSKEGMFSKKSYKNSGEVTAYENYDSDMEWFYETEGYGNVKVGLKPSSECFKNKECLEDFIARANKTIELQEKKWGNKREVVVHIDFDGVLFSDEGLAAIIKGVNNVVRLESIKIQINQFASISVHAFVLDSGKLFLSILPSVFYPKHVEIVNITIRKYIDFFREVWGLKMEDCGIEIRTVNFGRRCNVKHFGQVIAGIENIKQITLYLEENKKFLKNVSKYFPESIEKLEIKACSNIEDSCFYRCFYNIENKLKNLKEIAIFSCSHSITDDLKKKFKSVYLNVIEGREKTDTLTFYEW